MNNQPITQDLLAQLRENKSVILRSAIPLEEYQRIAMNAGAISHVDILKQYSPRQVGDKVPILEEWRVKHYYSDTMEWIIEYRDGSLSGEIRYRTKDEDDFGKLTDWKPAHTMPEEFSRYTAEVVKVDCIQLGCRLVKERMKVMQDSERPLYEYEEHWNDLNPDHPYDPDLWTFGFELKLIKEEKK